MKKIVLAFHLCIFYVAIYSQQNVGIGTNNPGSKLQVSGSLAAGWANQTTTPYNLGTNDYYDAWSGTANGTFNLPAAVNGAGNFVGRIYILKNATGAYTLTIQANGSEKIDGAASVTVQPGNSVTLISNGSTGAVTTWNVVSSTPSSGSATGWSTGGNAGTTPSSSPIGTAANNNFAGTTDAKDFVVATNNLERMRVTSSGNLGIGTTTPGYNLDISGYARASGEIMGTLGLGFGQFRAVSGNYGLMLRNDGANSYFLLTASGSPYGVWNGFRPFILNDATGDLSLANGNVFMQQSTGYEGIGTTSPSAQLHTTGTVRFGNYPGGMISTDASGNLQTVTIGGGTNQIDVVNGNGAGNPAIGIDPAYTAEMKSQAIMTGGGTVTYSGGNLSWSTRFIVINNGNGSQFSTSGYFDIYQPPNGTVIPGVGSAASVTVNASGVPLGCWDALYYIMPVGSNNGTVNSNFRIAQYAAGFVVPESWILIANNNCDDGSLRLGTGITLTAGQSSNNGSGAYIDNGTTAQTANYNITGAGTIGTNLSVGGNASTGGTLSVGGTSYFGGYITGMNGTYPLNNMVRLTPNLHLNSGLHDAVIMNWDNGNSGSDLNFRVGNGASVDVFDVLANGTVGVNTTTPAYTLDLNGGTFGFGLGNVRTEQRLDAGLMGNAGAQSGFFQNDGSTVTDYPAGASSWWHLIDCRHSNGANNFAMQFANSFYDQNLYFRETNNNAAQPWSRVMTSNDVNGTTNYISKFTSANTIGNSLMYDNGSGIGIGTTSPQAILQTSSAGVTKDVDNEYNGNIIIQGTSSGRTAVTGQGAELEFVIPANTDGSNPWGQGRIITVPGTSSNGDATGEMIIGTRRNYNKTGAGSAWYYGDDIAINGGGYVGIGNTSPNGKLDIYNTGDNGDGAVFAPDIDLDNNFTIQTYIDAAAGGGWANRTSYAGACCNNLALQPDAGTVSIGGTSGNYQPNKLNVIGQSYFDGNVGIDNASPAGPLDVAGRAGATSFKVGSSFTDLTNNSPWYGIGMSNLTLSGQGSTAVQIGGYYGLNFAESGANRMVINLGNVGIGTVNPGAPLDVTNTATIGIRYIKTGGADGRISLGDNSGTIWSWSCGWGAGGGGAAGDFSLLHEGISGDIIYVQASTNHVGIGTVSPAYPLDVSGEFHTSVSTTNTGVTTINALFDQTNSGYYAGIALRNTPNGGGVSLFGQYSTGSGTLSQALNVAQVSPFGGTNFAVVNANNYYYASDITLKKDIQDLGKDDFNACLEQIRNIRSIRYRYNNESATIEEGKAYRPELHLGLAAQSLPKEVTGNLSADPSSETAGTKLGVSVSDFNGLMLAGVKALDNHQQTTDELIKLQQQEIDELKKEIEELKVGK